MCQSPPGQRESSQGCVVWVTIGKPGAIKVEDVRGIDLPNRSLLFRFIRHLGQK